MEHFYRADYIDTDGYVVRPVRDGALDYRGRDLGSARERAIQAAAIPPERNGLRVLVREVSRRTLIARRVLVAHADGRVTCA